mmetsp:Transcript_21525/g.64405  ORF Transcript_21525/g.64405 Transcript_21525/m.64405 type:complete len:318 (-) Transcript_21525:88-1041(-)
MTTVARENGRGQRPRPPENAPSLATTNKAGASVFRANARPCSGSNRSREGASSQGSVRHVTPPATLLVPRSANTSASASEKRASGTTFFVARRSAALATSAKTAELPLGKRRHALRSTEGASPAAAASGPTDSMEQTRATRSGQVPATTSPTPPPSEWPSTLKRAWGPQSASAAFRASAAKSTAWYGPPRRSESPWPAMSSATTSLNDSCSASRGASAVKEAALSSHPCSSSQRPPPSSSVARPFWCLIPRSTRPPGSVRATSLVVTAAIDRRRAERSEARCSATTAGPPAARNSRCATVLACQGLYSSKIDRRFDA